MVKLIARVSVLALVLAVLVVFYFFLEHEYKNYLESPMQKDAKSFLYNFPSGTTLDKLVDDLYKKGIIKKPIFFKLYTRFNLDSTKLQAGVYEINPDTQSLAELMYMLLKGKIKRVRVRLPEGWQLKKVLAKISENTALKHEFNLLDEKLIKQELKLDLPNLEGMLYPDTYLVAPETSSIKLIKLAYETMLGILDTEWERRAKNIQIKTPYEALILASIIEKEASIEKEKYLVSGVFHNRLRKKMRLQTDPTIIYGMGEKFKGNITRKDLKTDNPYNTYTRVGLPPTPICLPSLSSIKAALNPDVTKDLFFVAKGDGTHYFSDSYKKHLKAVRKYQIESYKRRKTKEATSNKARQRNKRQE